MHQINASYGCNMKRTRSNWSGWQSDAFNKQFLTVYRKESCYCFIDFSQENARDFDSFTQFLPIKCSATSSINPQLPVFKLFFLNERSKKTLGPGPFSRVSRYLFRHEKLFTVSNMITRCMPTTNIGDCECYIARLVQGII